MAGEFHTLETIFPGNSGKMQLVRIMLRYGLPELHSMDRTKPLDEEFAEQMIQYREEVSIG